MSMNSFSAYSNRHGIIANGFIGKLTSATNNTLVVHGLDDSWLLDRPKVLEVEGVKVKGLPSLETREVLYALQTSVVLEGSGETILAVILLLRNLVLLLLGDLGLDLGRCVIVKALGIGRTTTQVGYIGDEENTR
jgi:hypothetical protein